MTLDERALAVRTREDLVGFLDAFHADFTVNRGSWENSDLASFLEAMAAWSQSMEGFYENTGEDIASVTPWRMLADLLMAGRVYE
jgi:hypothetical protein